MKAEEAKIGAKYLTKKGIPITVISFKDNRVIVRLENINKQIGIPKNSELKTFNEKDINGIVRYINQEKPKKAVKEGSLAAFIDPMLFEGKYTVKEIAEAIVKKAGEYAKNKDIEANIRARMVTYKRKGYQIIKNDNKQVKVVKK